MKEGEVDGGSSDGTDHEEASSAAPSVSRVSSSTNGNGNGTGVSVISGPLQLRRTLEAEHARVVGNALLALGSEVVAAAAAASAASTLPYALTSEAATSRLTSFLTDFGARNVSGTASNKSSGSDVSNSASPLSLNVVSGGKATPKPRAADSPGSGSTTSTTTGVVTPGRDKVFVCPICSRSFGYKHVLQNHERTHTGEKPFECRECKKRFTRDHHLKTHMRLHTGEKPYHCDHCDRQFVQVANLRRHLRVHTGERPYACQLCTSRFSDSNQLKAHMLIHKGEKPFECNKCLGRFRRRHHLMHHKCPKDEANFGKPRRGRRPKAYDNLTPAMLGIRTSPPTGSDIPALGAVSSSTAVLAAAATSSFPYPFQSSLVLPPLSGLPMPLPARDLRSLTPPAAHSASPTLDPSARKSSRRKQPQTTRILTEQQRALFLSDRTSMQTQPLNMSVALSPSNFRMKLPAGDVLDLSRSRSEADSEAEAIEEDIDEELDEEHDFETDLYEDETRTPSSISATSPRLHRSLLPGLSLRTGHHGVSIAEDLAIKHRFPMATHSLAHNDSSSEDEHDNNKGTNGNGNGGAHIKNDPEDSSTASNGKSGLLVR